MGSIIADRPFLPGLRLVLISFVSLYFELTLIRWIPTQVRLLAYFTNFVLIAALLGLGVGMLLAVRRVRLAWFFPAGLFGLTILVLVLERHDLVLPILTQGQFMWGGAQYGASAGMFAYLVLVAFFFLMVGVFVLLGQEVGLALRGFRPLIAYSLNILGSLFGVLAFALLNWLQTPPTVWFFWGAAGFVLYMLLTLTRRRGLLLLTLVPLVAVIGALHIDSLDTAAGTATYWSPYYKVQTTPMFESGQQVGYSIAVNKDALQFPMDLSGRYGWIPRIASEQHQYNLPYALLHSLNPTGRPKRVLILGAGTGNDVAAARRNAPGAIVDAVEIDPVVADLGRRLHPEHPYSSPNVHVHVTDARSYLQQTSQHYDLIVFGKLDSHRVFSHMSSVRMDNYVYTQENLETVRRHLAPNGMVALGFVVHEKWIADRLYTLLNRVFGHPPLVYQTDHYAFDTVYFVGNRTISPPPGSPTISPTQLTRQVLRGNPNGTWQYSQLQGFLHPGELSTHSTLLTDDWPYLYMQDRTVTPNYLIVLVLTVLASILLVWLTVPRIDFTSPSNWNFLFLGAGFALQETKGITDIALLFGSTWITNIIVISAILLVILLANFAVSLWPDIPLRWVYIALFAVLIVNYFLSLRGLLEYGFWVQVTASGVRVAGPLFFSGIIFARWFQRTDNPSAALGSNLMGAVVGGLAEYSSLALGLRDLYLLALLFYGLSFGLSFRPALRRTVSWRVASPGGE
jgi:SAM-dependent methyltransferase